MASDKKIEEILKSVKIDDVVKKAIKEATQPYSLNEAVVAQQKSYSQTTEFLTQKNKDFHTTLYKNYIDSFNKVSAELDSVEKSDVNSRHGRFRSAKLDETYNMNAVWLHELFFANCFDPNSTIYMNSISFLKLQASFGNFDDWQKDFMACGMSCGNGWAVCGYNFFMKKYVNTFISNHSQDVMCGMYPVIVVDMHEHSYVKDYLENKENYLVAMLRELNWDVIDERFKRAEAIAQVLK